MSDQPTKTTFAAFIAEAQERLNLDESDVARVCKVSIPTVIRWKSGKSYPHPLMAQAVREALS
jgi:transcriptional regulator with XRE-family HTH domain